MRVRVVRDARPPGRDVPRGVHGLLDLALLISLPLLLPRFLLCPEPGVPLGRRKNNFYVKNTNQLF